MANKDWYPGKCIIYYYFLLWLFTSSWQEWSPWQWPLVMLLGLSTNFNNLRTFCTTDNGQQSKQGNHVVCLSIYLVEKGFSLPDNALGSNPGWNGSVGLWVEDGTNNAKSQWSNTKIVCSRCSVICFGYKCSPGIGKIYLIFYCSVFSFLLCLLFELHSQFSQATST